MASICEIHTRQEAAVVAGLAREIWTEHYASLLSADQIDYMLTHFQSEEAIAASMAEGMRYFLFLVDKHPAGYFAYEAGGLNAGQDKLFLSKLYLRREARGQGLARLAVNHLLEVCRAEELSTIWLTVNKKNTSVAIYEKLGFQRMEGVVKDIGSGYVMCDYIMAMTVMPV